MIKLIFDKESLPCTHHYNPWFVYFNVVSNQEQVMMACVQQFENPMLVIFTTHDQVPTSKEGVLQAWFWVQFFGQKSVISWLCFIRFQKWSHAKLEVGLILECLPILISLFAYRATWLSMTDVTSIAFQEFAIGTIHKWCLGKKSCYEIFY